MKLQNTKTKNLLMLLKKKKDANKRNSIYKKTVQDFKKKYSISFNDAPIVFVKNDVFYHFIHTIYKSRGRTYESAEYIPYISAFGKFKRLERNDINL